MWESSAIVKYALIKLMLDLTGADSQRKYELM